MWPYFKRSATSMLLRGRIDGKISISAKKEDELITYKISDNGIGFSGEDSNKSRSLGITLIKTLGKQLKAQTAIKCENGASFEFTFKQKR